MTILTKIKQFFTVKKEQKFVVGVFLNGSFNVFDYKKDLLEKVQKSKDIMSAKKEKNSGIFTREFAKLIITKKLEKAGLSCEDAKNNAQHLFVHFAQQIIQLKNECEPKSNIVGIIECGDCPTNYCSNFGQIDFYVTAKKGGEISWTMDAKEFGFSTERDTDVAKQLQIGEFQKIVDLSKNSVENYFDGIRLLKVEQTPEVIKKSNANFALCKKELGELANEDAIEKALVETDMDYLDKEGVIKALHNDNKIKKAAMQTA